jgi:hypothetical protein
LSKWSLSVLSLCHYSTIVQQSCFLQSRYISIPLGQTPVSRTRSDT